MRRVLLVLLLVCSGCGKSDTPAKAGAAASNSAQASADLPVIVVDARHSLIDQQQGMSRPYTARAGGKLVLDATQFSFSDPQKLTRRPNIIQIIYDRSLYQTDWPPGARQVTVDPSKLTLIKGQPLHGFKPGTQAHIAIGYGASDPQSKTIEFTPFWVGSVLFI